MIEERGDLGNTFFPGRSWLHDAVPDLLDFPRPEPHLCGGADVPGLAIEGVLLRVALHFPPVVEMACYRIVTEALANVARHAHATRCAVRVHVDHGIRVDVRDNGAGLPAHWRAGVGIASMRERVSELGGELVIEPSRPHGTRVAARLPVREQP